MLDRLKASLDKDNAEGLPCAIVSDGMMPYVNGVELIARVHAKPAIRHIPVLLLSARASEEAHVEGLQAGADDYLAKPFSARVIFFFCTISYLFIYLLCTGATGTSANAGAGRHV